MAIVENVMSLHSIAVFKGLSGEAIRQLDQSCVPVEPRDGEAIFSQGDPADAVYAITGGDGHVHIGAIDRHSKALMVEVFRAGEIFGEIGVIDGRVRTTTATAVGRLRLMKIHQTVFLAALANYPSRV
jgi:CRP/FNR family transcriptional regulator, cyclic AMP receptor protein